MILAITLRALTLRKVPASPSSILAMLKARRKAESIEIQSLWLSHLQASVALTCLRRAFQLIPQIRAVGTTGGRELGIVPQIPRLKVYSVWTIERATRSKSCPKQSRRSIRNSVNYVPHLICLMTSKPPMTILASQTLILCISRWQKQSLKDAVSWAVWWSRIWKFRTHPRSYLSVILQLQQINTNHRILTQSRVTSMA